MIVWVKFIAIPEQVQFWHQNFCCFGKCVINAEETRSFHIDSIYRFYIAC